jgi:hypothetical protein
MSVAIPGSTHLMLVIVQASGSIQLPVAGGCS